LSASTPRILLIEATAAFSAALQAQASLQGCVFEAATGEADALRRLRGRSCDLVITSPHTTISHDLALLSEMREVRPGLKTILLAPEAATEDVIAALRASVFAVFAFPHDPSEVASMAHRALDAGTWQDGIEVRSAQPDWLSMRVDCRRLSAERVMTFLRELRPDIPEEARDEALTGFREVLLNAMEHGGQFDPDKVVEISAVRTARTIVYYVRDPGPGFKRSGIEHAASDELDADPIAHMEKRDELGMRPGGFGMLITKKVVDEMIYSEQGNEVILIKHLA